MAEPRPWDGAVIGSGIFTHRTAIAGQKFSSLFHLTLLSDT